MDTTLAISIAASDIKARYDNACKRILAEKTILAWIVKYTIIEYEAYDIEDIQKKYLTDKVILDEIMVLPDQTNHSTFSRCPPLQARGALSGGNKSVSVAGANLLLKVEPPADGRGAQK